MQNNFEIGNGILKEYKGHSKTIVIKILKKYKGNSKIIVIPNNVTQIGDGAFADCRSVISIQIPDSVTSIGNRAFYNCSSLTNIQLPDSIISIGDGAFCGCSSLTSVQIPNSITQIGDGAFWVCSNLTSIQIPASVTQIGDGAFSYCSSLTSIQILDSVISIGDEAFYGCNNLTIYGHKNSYVHKYAQQYGIPFVLIGQSKSNTSTSQKGTKLILNETIYICDNIVYLKDCSKINLENGTIKNGQPNPYCQWKEIHSQTTGLIGAIAHTLSMCVQIWKGIMPYHIQDVCNSLTAQMNLYLKQYGLTGKLTENSWKFSYKNKPIPFEKIFDIIPANAPLKESPREIVKLNIKEQWTLCNNTLNQNIIAPSPVSTLPDNTTFFYESGYVCPSCGRKLNKILIQPDSHIRVNGKEEFIRTVFSCKYCNEFFAQFRLNPLGSGRYFHLKVSKQRYNEIVLSLDACGRQRETMY